MIENTGKRVCVEKKEAAYELYKSGKFTQEEIAKMLCVSTNAVGNWKNEFGWEKRKLAYQTQTAQTEEMALAALHYQQEVMKQYFAPETPPTDGIKKAIPKELIDSIEKLSKQYQLLRQKIPYSSIAVILSEFSEWIADKDSVLTEKLLPFVGIFLESKTKEYYY